MKRHKNHKETQIAKMPRLQRVPLAVPHSFHDEKGLLDTLYIGDDKNWDEFYMKYDRIALINHDFTLMVIRTGKKLIVLMAKKYTKGYCLTTKQSVFTGEDIGNYFYDVHIWLDLNEADCVQGHTITSIEDRLSVYVLHGPKSLIGFTTSFSDTEWTNHLCESSKKWQLIREILLLNDLPIDIMYHFRHKYIWALDPICMCLL